MRFWDSSAVVPLVCREQESARYRTRLREAAAREGFAVLP
jgi:uncharacterized protein with PIN domain